MPIFRVFSEKTGSSSETSIREILLRDKRVIFAYLYGSFTEKEPYRDIDIAVYALPEADAFSLPSDLKVALGEKMGLSPDMFDVRIINGLLEYGDLFALCYLRRVFEKNRLLVDKDVVRRTDFIERYNLKYRECEGLLDAVKYILIELAEAIANVLQHILAKEQGIAVSGYVDTIVKGYTVGIISQELFCKLKPFLDFRNSLIHRYWTIDDHILIQNLHKGSQDFPQFVTEIEEFVQQLQTSDISPSGNTPERDQH